MSFLIGFQYDTVLPAAATARVHTPRCDVGQKYLDYLLIFNPTSDATSAKQSLTQGTLRWRTQVCKHRASFKEDNYQVVYVAPGLMGEQERERSKVLTGLREQAPLLIPVSL